MGKFLKSFANKKMLLVSFSSRHIILIVFFLKIVSDQEIHRFVLNLGPVDSPLARPIRNAKGTIKVEIKMSLYQVQDVVCSFKPAFICLYVYQFLQRMTPMSW